MKQTTLAVGVLVLLLGMSASGCITGSGPDATILEELAGAGTYETLLSLLDAAGLTGSLSESGPFTLFAPDDAAFAALPEGKLDFFRERPDALSAILLYHVAGEDLSTADVSKKTDIPTLEGSTLPVRTAGAVTVGGAALGDDIDCTNGSLIPVNAVLVPASVSDRYIDLTFTDGAGRSVYLAEVPQRIVSLASSATEVLFAIGADDAVVGVDKFSTYPAEATTLPNLGSGSALAMEELLALEPDLVVIWYFYGDAIQSLEGHGLPVMAINPASIDDIFDLMALLGSITGTGEEAQSVIDTMAETIDAIEEYVATIVTDERPKVYYETSQPFKTLNNQTFTGEIISRAGGINIAGELETKYPVLASEWIIQQDPDVIVVLSYGASIEEIKARDGWSQIAAVRNDRVYAIESNWMTSNPRLVLGFEQLAKWLYPEQFQ